MNSKASERIIVITCILILAGMFVGMTVYYFVGFGYSDKIADNVNKATDELHEETEIAEEKALLQEKLELSIKENNGLFAELTLEEKIAQMFFVTPEAINIPVHNPLDEKTIAEALDKNTVGGIIFFAQNIQTRSQIENAISLIKKHSKITPLFGIDEEGGRVARLGKADVGVRKHPAMAEIGESGEPGKAYEIGKMLGEDLFALGFSVDFAPVADVITNEKNSEIGDRSFGKDPIIVSKMVEAVVKGLEANGVSSVLKHFPGHGSTQVDSHTGYSESNRQLSELRNNEFLPFKAGIAAGCDFVMISHMTPVNAIQEKVPASLSKEIITDMLKKELGFNGIVITDSFSMGAITDNYSVEEAVVKTVQAGTDMILMPSNYESARVALINAVKNGKITEERIDESVRKILALKEKC